MFDLSWTIDGWTIVAGALCGLSAALLGNFLVLRRLSLLGDAISHAILPGLAAAYLLTGERQGWMIFLGAASVGLLTVMLTESARYFGQVDEGAAIGVVFTFLFALGLVMIVRAADRVDLDPGCVLYGSLETTILDCIDVAGVSIPRGVISLSVVTLINLAFVVVLYRPLKVSTFDSQLALAQGIPVQLLHYALAGLVAVTSVAAFESVGNILVVAMFVVPPVTAWLWTDRLSIMILLSAFLAVLTAIVGHLAAIAVPRWFGYHSTNTAGMMATTAGMMLFLTVLFATRKGLLSRAYQSYRTAIRIVSEDILGILFRSETGSDSAVPLARLRRSISVSSWKTRMAIRRLVRNRWVEYQGDELRLTEAGRMTAQNVVRSHRLWEHYLATEAGVAESELHAGAERFEHFTDRDLRERLVQEGRGPSTDPHGKHIPPEAH